MIATVKLYYNTGLTVSNCLDSLSKLDSLGFSNKDFPSIAIKQDRGLISIRLNTTYDNVKDADYCKINNVGYWVVSTNMLNDNVAEIELQQDYLTTAGVSNIEIISGWCTRKHVQVDGLFDNTIDENFVPTEPLKVEFGNEISPGPHSGQFKVLVSTLDLLDTSALAKTFSDGASGLEVVVPLLPIKTHDTNYTMTINGSERTTQIADTCVFDITNQAVINNMKNIRSLGIDSAIVASYVLPQEYVTAFTGSGGKITNIKTINKDVNSGLDPAIPGNYKNKKVHSGQFQKIVLTSLVSGEMMEFQPEDIQRNGSIVWNLTADPTFNGYPICRPKNYHYSDNNYYLATIKGAQWINSPISWAFASGAGLNTINYAHNATQYGVQSILGASDVASYSAQNQYRALRDYNIASSKYNFEGADAAVGMSNIGMLMGGLGGFSAGASFAITQNSAKAMLANQNYPRPDVKFSIIPSLQNYIGNNFFEYRYRLSDNDMVRFDNYLTQFGYAVNETLDSTAFSGRAHFNYVLAEGVDVKISTQPAYIRDGVARQLESGVRIWHTAPSHSKLLDNPIS